MRAAKGLDLARVAATLLHHHVAKSAYLQGRLDGLLSPPDLEAAVLQNIQSSTLEKNMTSVLQSLESFVRDLYRDELPAAESVDKAKAVAATVAKIKGTEKRSKTQRVPNAQVQKYKEADPPRNRKGQRARRLEWERLYGKAAAHLQKRPTAGGRPGAAAKATAATPAATATEKLHPSWEAQRRQRELLKAAASQKPANQRIKFVDDQE